MPVPYVKKWTKVKQETNAATKKVTVHCAKNDVIVIDDDNAVVIIDADNDGEYATYVAAKENPTPRRITEKNIQ